MGILDYLLMAVIFAWAVYLLYRSLFRKKNHCPGCHVNNYRSVKRFK